MEFKLEGEEYIELKNLLKVTGLVDTGAEGKGAVAEGLVSVDGQIETRKSCKIKSGQIVAFKGRSVKVID